MKIRYVAFKGLFVILALLLSANFVLAQDKTAKRAEKLMIWQLEAIKNGDYQRFIEHGNKAFKEFMNAYSFDTFKQLKGENIAKGYKLKYLGAIRRIGVREHLWKIYIADDKYELLGTLSLSDGKVVGFNLE